ncbi:GDYXXLXY domain-containing protein [Acidovorax sp. LjRoot66]|uniref:GDYXXLXY domain-containing protein n=1 Tax=Acidovorax sp. LjRoot66 TaxID=3342334 RepID=UPI003ECD9562
MSDASIDPVNLSASAAAPVPKPGALETIVQAAVAQGILPPGASSADAHRAGGTARPWPVVLLTALGAWLAALPLLAMFGLFFGEWIVRDAGAYLIGAVVLAGATAALRSKDLPIFLEQLAFPALLTGAGLLGFAFGRDMGLQPAAAFMLVVALGVAALVALPWLRVLLGAGAAALFAVLIWPGADDRWALSPLVPWSMVHSVLAVWVGLLLWQRHALGRGTAGNWLAALLEPLACGWLLVLLWGICGLSGQTFLVGGAFGAGIGGELVREVGREVGPRAFALQWLVQAASVLLALVAAAIAQRAWPVLRQPRAGVVALVLALLCWFSPLLGSALLALAIAGTTRRWGQATAAALACTWIMGGFYYLLAWPLTTKAMVLVGCGALLGVLAWSALRTPRAAAMPGETGHAARHWAHRMCPWLLVLSAVATVAVANIGIADKENTIANGQKVYVPLAPVDPRSLMQGDYMRLRFTLPPMVDFDRRDAGVEGLLGSRPYAVGRLDARGVVAWERVEKYDAPIAPGEFRIQLTPKNGDWTLVTDGWYFAEGDASRWEQARFGEFRVQPDGKALLVGMADDQLVPIGR